MFIYFSKGAFLVIWKLFMVHSRTSQKNKMYYYYNVNVFSKCIYLFIYDQLNNFTGKWKPLYMNQNQHAVCSACNTPRNDLYQSNGWQKAKKPHSPLQVLLCVIVLIHEYTCSKCNGSQNRFNWEGEMWCCNTDTNAALISLLTEREREVERGREAACWG